MSIEASLSIGAAAGKSCVDVADAVEMLSKDCGYFQPLVDEVVLELLEKMLQLQLSWCSCIACAFWYGAEELSISLIFVTLWLEENCFILWSCKLSLIFDHELVCHGCLLPHITSCGDKDRESWTVMEVLHVEGLVHSTINPFGEYQQVSRSSCFCSLCFHFVSENDCCASLFLSFRYMFDAA